MPSSVYTPSPAWFESIWSQVECNIATELDIYPRKQASERKHSYKQRIPQLQMHLLNLHPHLLNLHPHLLDSYGKYMELFRTNSAKFGTIMALNRLHYVTLQSILSLIPFHRIKTC